METASLLLNEPSLLIENKDLACLICNSVTSLQNSYSVFYTVLPNKGTLLCNSVQKVIKRVIDPDGIRSTVLCSRCFSLFDELEICEERCFQLRQNIISWFNTSCQIYGDLNSLVADGIACQTDPTLEEILNLPPAVPPPPFPPSFPPSDSSLPLQSAPDPSFESAPVEDSNALYLSDNEPDSPDANTNDPEYIEDPRSLQTRLKMIGPLSKEAMRRIRRYRHECHHCKRMFRRPSELKKHMLSHMGAKPFACSKCDRTFASKQGVTIHLLRTHAVEAGADNSPTKDKSMLDESHSSENPDDYVQAVITENVVPNKPTDSSEFDDNDDASELFNSAPNDYDDDFEWKEEDNSPHVEPEPSSEPTVDYEAEAVAEMEYLEQQSTVKSEKRSRKSKAKNKTPSDDGEETKEEEDGASATAENSEDGEKKSKTKRVRKRGNRASERYSMPAVHECDQCGKKWRTVSELKSHIASHSSLRPYVCEICGQGYKMRKALDVHVGMHNGIHPYTCHICNKSFTQKVGLQKHLPIHTGYTRFQCDLCGKRFIHHKSFNIHKMTHTGEKTIKCTICGLAVLSQSHLKRHYRVHTGERPYACEICGKRFAEKYNLNAHGRVHDPESSLEGSRKKVHRCQLCGVCYDRKHKLEDHLASTHNKLSEDRAASSVVLGDLQTLNYFNRAFTN